MGRKVGLVASGVEGAPAPLPPVPPGPPPRADRLLRLAVENVELVRIGRGAHNVAFADDLLRAAVDLVRRAVRAGSLPYEVPALSLGPPVSETVCLQCHLDMERKA